MPRIENLKIIAFVGLTGSGKSTAVEYFTNKGYPKVYFGGIIYQAMEQAGIEKGEENEKIFRIEIRQKEGEDFVVKRIIQQIEDLAEAGQKRIIADGLYTWEEYKALRSAFPGSVSFVAINAPKKLRYRWLETREDRPQTPQISAERDANEIEDMQKGGPIAASDYFVINDKDIEHLYKQLDGIAEDIEF